MAKDNDGLDNPFGSFSIENTMEMGGVGSAELLGDLFAPETSTASPDTIEKIETPPVKKEVKKAAVKTAAKTDEEEEEEDKEDPKKSITDFLKDGEEEEEEEVVTKKDTTDEEEEEEKAPNQFAALAKDLFKLNVFTTEEGEQEEEINTPEQFLERFETEKKKGAIQTLDKFIGQFGEDYQNAFDAIFVKGVDPKEYFGTYNNIQNFAEMDLSQEANQVAVLRQALLDQGFDSEDISSEIERIKNYGDLESVAQKHHKVLIKKEAQKLAQVTQESERKLQQLAAIKQQYAQNVQNVLQEKLKAKEFDGIPINPKLANELQDFLLVDKYKTPSGETLTDFDKTILELKRPENHGMKVKVGLLLKLLQTDPTLSTIQKAGITKKTDALFGEVARQAGKSSVKSGSKSTGNSIFSHL